MCSNITEHSHISQLCLSTLWRPGVYKLLISVRESVVCGGLASAQPHTLLLAHVGTHKEGFQLPFALHIDEPSTVARVAQLLQHIGRFLCDLEEDRLNSCS